MKSATILRKVSIEECPGALKQTKNIHYKNKPIEIYWKFYNQTRKIFR